MHEYHVTIPTILLAVPFAAWWLMAKRRERRATK